MAECRSCMIGPKKWELIRDCPSVEACNLWPYRMGKWPKHGERRPLKAIRKHCLNCVGGVSFKDVRDCTGRMHCGGMCRVWGFRFGVRPGTRANIEKRTNPPLRDRLQPNKAMKSAGAGVGMGQEEIDDSSAENVL